MCSEQRSCGVLGLRSSGTLAHTGVQTFSTGSVSLFWPRSGDRNNSYMVDTFSSSAEQPLTFFVVVVSMEVVAKWLENLI